MSRNITRRQFLTGAAILGLATVLAGGVTNSQNKESAQVFIPRVLRAPGSGSLNFLVIMSDSLRYDHIAFLGNDWIKTPNLDALAAQSVTFDRFYMGGFPTVINRAELFTGRWHFPDMSWENLPAGETTLAEMLTKAGYNTGLVFDTWLLKDDGFTFDRGFSSWEWIRGQLLDRYRTTPPSPPLPASPAKLRNGEHDITQYLRNVSDRQTEPDYFVARTAVAAIQWLKRNHSRQPFYLHVDCFDPHEPWDPPQSYVDLYDPGYEGEEVIYPAYAPPDYLTDSELQHVRALYAAEITLVDRWIGELLHAVETLGLSEDTVVIFNSDHGYMLGEHDAIGKMYDHNGVRRAYPLWEGLAHVPLMIRMPDVQPRRTTCLAQPLDLAATLLDLAELPIPPKMHGISLAPILRHRGDGPEPEIRPISVSARSLLTGLGIQPRITVADGEWTLHHGGGHASSALFNLSLDPRQENNVLDTNCAVAESLHSQLMAFLRQLQVPEDRLATWQAPPC
ncbi:MAG: sulfatase-like hydrolase/transferase [Caldilineales bacterium]|nr:sulfatase-like hydrolase/transferase [Caldilineales bacterium]